MAKVKFYYDPENLAYKKIQPKRGRQIGYIFLWLLSAALFGFLGMMLLVNSNVIGTPIDKMQKREIENLKFRYTVLNKKLNQIDQVLADIAERDNNLYRVYFNADAIPLDQRKTGFGGDDRYKDLEGFDNSELIKNTTKRMDVISKELVIQSKSLDEIYKLALSKESLLSAIPAIQPIKNEELKRMASGFGYRNDPFTKIRKFHAGMDFTAKTGTPIYATGDGVVTRADNRASGYGEHVVIQHGYGYETLYAHLSKYNVTVGKKVKRGDVIGYVGSTGRSEAPHLHYEVRINGEPVNPINFYYGNISAEEFEVISKQANQENQSLD
ncbi:MAG: M23 family metallopeptidase [Bacteroidota bacterium]|nr:M23 family metallopeptidase [Bacteroidota bacterium]